MAALTATMLGGTCMLAAHAEPSAEEDPEEEQTKEVPKAPPNPTGPPGKKKQDPAEALRAIEAALKQLQAGKAEQAVQAMSVTLAGGNLPPPILAKAFYVRGLAHRQQQRPAHAVSDLSSALWLKGGLGGEERADAIKQKAAAYADSGLSGEPDETRPKTSGGNWLSGLFGGSGSSPPPQPRPPPPTVKPPPAPEGWSSKTQVLADKPAPVVSPPPPPPKAEPTSPRAEPSPPQLEGHYQVQLAAVRTEAEAKALAAKAKREHASVLASLESRIDRAVLGNMGAFYRVRFGPFATVQESQAVCARLQDSGIDCMPVGP